MDNDRSNIFKTSANVLLISIGGKHLTLNARAVMNTYDYRLNHERYVKMTQRILTHCQEYQILSFKKMLMTATGLEPTTTCVSTYLYGAFDCMFLSCHVRFSE